MNQAVMDIEVRDGSVPPPQRIKVRSGEMCGGFGKCEVEVTAGRLVLFFQQKGIWAPFTISELAEFYREKGWNPDEMFFGLIGGWFDDSPIRMHFVEPASMFLVCDSGGRWRVTQEFVLRCAGRWKPKPEKAEKK